MIGMSENSELKYVYIHGCTLVMRRAIAAIEISIFTMRTSLMASLIDLMALF